MNANDHALAQLRLCCELLCESHNKRKMPRRVQALIAALTKAVRAQEVTKGRIETLAHAMLTASDGMKEDFEIVDNKLYIAVPMHIDPQELARRVIW